jgi:predicted ferric reductase
LDAIDISGDVALVAITLLTVNILLGILMSVKYNPVRSWPHRRVDTVLLHNWTGYLALAASALHPLIILLSSTVHFRLTDILYPVNAPKQPWINTLGAAALYLLIFTVVTSYFRFEIGRKWWKRMHYVTYALFVLFAVHAVLTDPTLKDAPLDPLDAEKVYVELCILLVVVATGWRVRWSLAQPPARKHRPKDQRAKSKPALAVD